MGGAHPHPSANALLARLASLLHRFRPHNGESTELPQPSRPSAFHIHALLARLSSLIHSSPPENDAPDELQQPSTPSRVDPRVLLARLSTLLHRSRLNTDEEAEPHPTTPSSSRSDPLISRLTSLFRSQPHANEDIELAQRSSRPRVVEVAAVRDRQVCLSSIRLHSLCLLFRSRLWLLLGGHCSRKQNEHMSKLDCKPKPRLHHRRLNLLMPQHPRHILLQQWQPHNHHLSRGGLKSYYFSVVHIHDMPTVINTASVAAFGQLLHHCILYVMSFITLLFPRRLTHVMYRTR
jgi:hypothetical protein